VLAVFLASLTGVAPLAAGAPVAASCSFSVSVSALPSAGPTPLLVRFNATVSSGTPTAFDWTFGDGGDWNSSVPGADAPLHRYDRPGEYLTVVRVSEGACVAQGSVNLAASPEALSVAITATPDSGGAPLTVEFSAAIVGGSGTYVSASWSFGDGGVGSGLPIAYTYRTAGSFAYAVNVTDSQGHWAVANGTEVVRAASHGTSGGFLGLPDSPWVALATVLAVAAVVGAGLYFRGRRTVRAAPGRADLGSGGGRPRPTAPVPESLGRADSEAPVRRDPPSAGEPTPAVAFPTAAASPAGRAPTSLGSAPSRERVQLTQQVILHIGAQGRIGAEEIGRLALTQAGMAAELGVRQNTLTNVLRRLVAAGVLTQDVRHVSGQPRRLRVYRFTSRGESVYRDVRLRRPRSAPGAPGGESAAGGAKPR
jgi:DNA-binding MarR family transcriptional regulator